MSIIKDLAIIAACILAVLFMAAFLAAEVAEIIYMIIRG